MRTLIFVFVLASAVICSCSGKKKPDNALARVYNEYLTPASLQGIVPAGIYGEDSIQVIRDYITSWTQQQLLIRQAESNLSKEQKDFSQQLEDYRNSLIIYSYERELVRQKLDTTVDEKEIADYYEAHTRDFELKDNIVKAWYVKLLRNAPAQQFRQLIRSERPADQEKLVELVAKHAANSYLDDNNWLVFNDILKEIPIKTYNQEEYLKNNRYIEITDTSYIYMLNIKGFMIKESISPLSFERQNIKSIILNKRKLKLIADMKNTLYKEAIRKGDLEFYKP